MNFGFILRQVVAFLAFYLIWVFLSVCVLPHMTGMIGLPSLYPHELWRGIYKVLEVVSQQMFGYAILLILLAWMVYNLINALPGILKGLIGWVWWPFPDFISSGIFPLIDYIVAAIFSNASVKYRFQLIAEGLKGMFINGTVFLINDIVELGIIPNATKVAEPPLYNFQDSAPPVNPLPITSQVQATIDQKYNECLQQKLINITSDMSTAETQIANTANQATLVTCKLGQFYGAMDILAQRAGSIADNVANR